MSSGSGQGSGGSPGGLPPGYPTHPPYPPMTWALGGTATKIPDIPITAVFLTLFLGSAIMHMTIFRTNSAKGHKFLISSLMIMFSMARVVSCVLRIASICLPKDIPLALAAMIFLQVGVVIMFIVDLIFVQRILRAVHKHSAWHPMFTAFFYVVYALIILTIAAVIVVVVQTFYSLNTNTHRIDRDVQLYGLTFFAAVSFLPILLLAVGLLIPWSKPTDRFGAGHLRTKIILVLISSSLLCFGASYRAYTNWHTPVMRTKPLPSTFGKAPFYIAYFTVEIIVLYMYGIFRVDRRFHVPNGAHGPGSYSTSTEKARQLDTDDEKRVTGMTSAGLVEEHGDGPHRLDGESEDEFVDAREDQNSIEDPERGMKSLDDGDFKSSNKVTPDNSPQPPSLPMQKANPAPIPPPPVVLAAATQSVPTRPVITSRLSSRLSNRLASTSKPQSPPPEDSNPRLTIANNPRLDSMAFREPRKTSRGRSRNVPSLALPNFGDGLGLDFERQQQESLEKRESLKQQRLSGRQELSPRTDNMGERKENAQRPPTNSNAIDFGGQAVEQTTNALPAGGPLSSHPTQSASQPTGQATTPALEEPAQKSPLEKRNSKRGSGPFGLPRFSFGSTQGDDTFMSSFGGLTSNNKAED